MKPKGRGNQIGNGSGNKVGSGKESKEERLGMGAKEAWTQFDDG